MYTPKTFSRMLLKTNPMLPGADILGGGGVGGQDAPLLGDPKTS